LIDAGVEQLNNVSTGGSVTRMPSLGGLFRLALGRCAAAKTWEAV